MTKEQILKIISKYDSYLIRFYSSVGVNIDQEECNEEYTYGETRHIFSKYKHILYMIHEIRTTILEKENDIEKANRWLGFIQGVLWAAGDYSISDLREHNREGKNK